MLPIYLTDKNLDFEDLLKLKPQRIEHDWFGATAETLPTFVLARDPLCLWFYAAYAAKPLCETGYKCGAFVEGLWKQDVAELFVCHDTSPAYQEFNLSPSGAWWSSKFESYRKPSRLAAEKAPQIKCFSLIDNDSWQAAMAIPLALFAGFTSLCENSRVNVAFITDTPKQRFWSWAKIQARRPDFHCADQFEALQLIRE